MGDVIDFQVARANPPPTQKAKVKKKKKKKKYGLVKALKEFGQSQGKQHAPKKKVDGET
jgi:hypothetical protein